MGKVPVTAAMLYDLVQCPHRLSMDLVGDLLDRDKINPFIELLWEKGTAHEKSIVEGFDVPFLDLSHYAGDEKERFTTEAMERGEPIIYGGRIQADDLLGVPDLLREEAGSYVAGDIKSGAGEEGQEELKKPKKHYAVQVALYTDILERKGLSAGRRPYIIDIHGEEVMYELDELQGKRNPTSMWDWYQETLSQARKIVAKTDDTLPAYSSTCKLCHWYTVCQHHLEDLDDLTLLPELGRARRDAMINHIATVSDLATVDVSAFVSGKKTAFKGIGPDMLQKFQDRAKLVKSPTPKPYLSQPVTLPNSDLELFFDIEVDPMRDICYLQGFVERQGGDDANEKYVAFFAEEPTTEAEEEIFRQAYEYVRDKKGAVIYYYAPYEHTWWSKLQERYSDVCSSVDIEEVFEPTRAIDLYTNVVRKATEWPTRDYSLKTLAMYLGFDWRDTHPSGAASIQWFDEWVKSGDEEIKQRILEYNEDDCRAMRVLLDAIREM